MADGGEERLGVADERSMSSARGARRNATQTSAADRSQERIEIEVRLEMGGQCIEGGLDAVLVADAADRRRLPRKARRKRVGGEEAVEIGAGDEAIGG